jgi:hypothetical protein
MTPKLLNLANNSAKWLLAALLLFVLVRGFLQIPEVSSRISPDLLWEDYIYQLHKEYDKVKEKLRLVESLLANLNRDGRPEPLKMHLINKNVVSITRSLRFMDARLASLDTELEISLLQAPLTHRPGLNAYLREVKTLQVSCRTYHRNLQEVSQKVQSFQARLNINPGQF